MSASGVRLSPSQRIRIRQRWGSLRPSSVLLTVEGETRHLPASSVVDRPAATRRSRSLCPKARVSVTRSLAACRRHGQQTPLQTGGLAGVVLGTVVLPPP
jgi:hypothetical protein